MIVQNFLAGNLQYLRSRKRLSQHEIAQALGLSRSQIASYESGKAEPSASKLAKIVAFFDVSLNQLLNEDLQEKSLPRNDTAIAAAGRSVEMTGEHAAAMLKFEARAARHKQVADGLLAMHEIKNSSETDMSPAARSLQRELENLLDFTSRLMQFNGELLDYLKGITGPANPAREERGRAVEKSSRHSV